MKKYFKALSILLVLITAPSLKAQTNDKKSENENNQNKVVITANAGQSLVGSLFEKGRVYANSHEEGITLSQSPALQLSGDYYVSPYFSVGAAVSYQQFLLNVNHWKYLDDVTSTYKIVDFNAKITRTQIGVRVLFHFYNKKRFNMFSGIRLGPTIWKISSNSPDPAYQALGSLSAGAFAFQLVYFGMRGYITDSFGLNLELAVGSPYYISGGLTYRFLK